MDLILIIIILLLLFGGGFAIALRLSWRHRHRRYSSHYTNTLSTVGSWENLTSIEVGLWGVSCQRSYEFS